MPEDEIETLHQEANKDMSHEEEAKLIFDVGIPDSELIQVEKKVLLMVLKLHGVDHNSLNISISKFNKKNKKELVQALRSHAENPAPQEQTKPVKEAVPFDLLGSVFEIKEEIEKARISGTYKKLDASVADKLLNAVNNDDAFNNLPVNSTLLMRFIIAIGVCYFLARLIGFETLANKLMTIKNKALNKGTNEPKKDEKHTEQAGTHSEH